MREVVIAGAVRTAIGKLSGALYNMSAVELGASVLRSAVDRSEVDPSRINEIIFGQVIQAGAGPNPARQALLRAQLPNTLPAFTVNKVCASGMKAVSLGYRSIASGEHDVVGVGGMESMSLAPFVLSEARKGYRLGNGELVDTILRDALDDPILSRHMGTTAETLANEFEISRHEQDSFAYQSHMKAIDSIASGRFVDEIVPISIPQKRGDTIQFQVDEHPRKDTSPEALAKLKPAFDKNGSVTAGNSSGLNDGAAAMVLLSADVAKSMGIKPMARIVSSAATALEPERMGLGPVSASRLALDRAGLSFSDIDAVELNEAFAAQSLSVIQELDLDPSIVNVNGGAIALGHPVGATGARIIVTLLYILKARNLQFGLATLCVGGGQGMAMVLEAL